ncbi:hypothetical protein Pan14r_51120 [Crateriforma conspicua]|uniref:Polysaccharide biosynthesis protein n=2 Tax=Crateriforma conspicua TaxID=2527996 RepID=A0A5C5XU63_9PLAN|nr:hypothetical protein Pan14r_51120 [Crateriforma conspicua]
MAIRQILMVPLLIRLWGPECYGEWLALSAIPTFLAMSNLGLGTAAAIAIGMEASAGKVQQAWGLFASTTVILLAFFTLIFCGFAGVLLWFPEVAGHYEHLKSPVAIVVCLAMTTLLKLLAPTWQGWWIGVRRPAMANHWNNLNGFVELVICILIVASGGDALMLASMLLAWNVVWIFAYSFATLRMLRSQTEVRILFKPQWHRTTKLLRTGLGHQLSPLWQAILFQGSILLAASLLGPAGAALWGSLRIMVRAGCQIIELVSQSLGPEFQLAYGSEDREQLRKLHSVGLSSSIGISAIGIFALVTIGPYVFDVWTDGQFSVGNLAWWTMSSSLLPFSMWWVSGELQRATNSPWFINLCGVVVSLLSVGIMYACSGLGIIAFCFGGLCFDGIMALLVLNRTLQMLDADLRFSLTEGIETLSDWAKTFVEGQAINNSKEQPS